MTSILNDLDALSTNVQVTIHTALVSQSITGFAITDLFTDHRDKDTEAVAIAALSEPMCATTIIKATFAGSLDAISLTYGKLSVAKLEAADVQIPDAFYMRPGDVEKVVSLFNETLGSGRSYADALYSYSPVTDPHVGRPRNILNPRT